jgi:hypothetical protein
MMTDLPVSLPFRMDTRVLLACLALSALSALLCGLAPALQSTRVDLVNGLKSADVDVPGRRRLWGRNVLVVAQVSTSLMLLTASFLMVRGFQHALLDGTGFAKGHLLMTSFDPRLVQYNAAQTQQFYKLPAERLTSLAIHDQEFDGSNTGGRWKLYRPFVQDDWRVTKSLTLNLGFAWALVTPVTEVANRQSDFDPATGQFFLS